MKKVLKWFGIVLGGLIGILVIAAIALYLLGSAKFSKNYNVSASVIPVPTDDQSIQRGKHLATIFMCTGCHSEDFSGKEYFTIPGMLNIPTPNLTTGDGGVGGLYSVEDWSRAIRHGVAVDGRAIFIMMSRQYAHISDEDLCSLIAYLQSLPPIDNQLSQRRLEFLGLVMMGAGMMPPLAADQIDHSNTQVGSVEPGVTVDYGRYLTFTCTECHGENFNGAPFGPPGQEVITPNLTPGGELVAWSEQDFIDTMRTGVTPSGRTLSEDMPWKYFGQMTDDELKAVWMYLRSLPALPVGQ